MTWKKISPSEKCEGYEEDLTRGRDGKNNALSDSDKAFRAGYIRGVTEQNKWLISILTETSEQIEAYKQKLKGYEEQLKSGLDQSENAQERSRKTMSDKKISRLFGLIKPTPQQREAYMAKRRKQIK